MSRRRSISADCIIKIHNNCGFRILALFISTCELCLAFVGRNIYIKQFTRNSSETIRTTTSLTNIKQLNKLEFICSGNEHAKQSNHFWGVWLFIDSNAAEVYLINLSLIWKRKIDESLLWNWRHQKKMIHSLNGMSEFPTWQPYLACRPSFACTQCVCVCVCCCRERIHQRIKVN